MPGGRFWRWASTLRSHRFPAGTWDARAFYGELNETLALFLKVGGWVYVFSSYVAWTSMCVGPSMLPTLEERGNLVIKEHLSVRFGLIRDGDVVIARPPDHPQRKICKRVSATGGEPAVRVQTAAGRQTRTVVPPGHVWLLGDNPSNSRDSRTFGPVPLAMVQGKVVFQLWPLHKFGPVRRRVVDDHERLPDRSSDEQVESLDGRLLSLQEDSPTAKQAEHDRSVTRQERKPR